nr:unnamed protein product [Spirometra erinaceieuropaei]
MAASEIVEGRLRTPRNEKAVAVGTEKKCSAFSWRTVDNFDRGEEVLPFVAVRVSSDLLGLASRSCVLHLAQPLLCKVTTTVESSSVVVDGAIDKGLAQAVLLGEKIADGGVVLATCTTEDRQDGRQDRVPQFTSSVIHGGVLVSGGGGGGDWKADQSLSWLIAEMEMVSGQRQQGNIQRT